MILHYFRKKENKHDKEVFLFYKETIEIVKKIVSHTDKKRKKDFNLIFEIITILLFSIFYAIKNKNNLNLLNYKDFNKQDLMDIFITDIDHSLRLSGIGDMNIGKHVKLYVKKFYFRVSELEILLGINCVNYLNFNQYLLKYNIILENTGNFTSKSIFFKFKKLIDRCVDKKINISIYDDLFK